MRPTLLVVQHLVHDHLHELAGAVADAGVDVVTWCTYLDDRPPVAASDVAGVISLGGDDSAYEDRAYIHAERDLLADALARGIPVLGLCFGAQLLAIAAGGRGFPAQQHEIGWTEVEYLPEAADDPLGELLVASPHVFQYHYDTFSLPAAAVVLGRTSGMPQAYRIGPRAWGLQFHLEAGPGLVYDWLGTYAEELADKGVDPDAVQSDTTRYWRTYRDVAWAVAERFCGIVLTPRSAD